MRPPISSARGSGATSGWTSSWVSSSSSSSWSSSSWTSSWSSSSWSSSGLYGVPTASQLALVGTSSAERSANFVGCPKKGCRTGRKSRDQADVRLKKVDQTYRLIAIFQDVRSRRRFCEISQVGFCRFAFCLRVFSQTITSNSTRHELWFNSSQRSSIRQTSSTTPQRKSLRSWLI